MAIRTVNSDIAAINGLFQGLSSLFAPPSAQDRAAYANAAATRAQQERIAQLWDDPNLSDWDKRAIAAGLYNPTQSFYAQDQNDATTRRGQDLTLQGTLGRTAMEQEGAMARQMAQPVLVNENQTAFLPGQTQAATGLGNMLFGNINVGQGEVTTTPDGRTIAGPEKPLTETEHNASVLAGMPLDQQRAVAFGSTPIEQIVMGDGPINVTRPEAIGQRPAAGPDETAATQRIERLTENLMATGHFLDPAEARNIAVGITDGRLRADHHPVTGELQVVDMATGRPAYEPARQSDSGQPGALSGSFDATQFGPQYSRANEAFGVGGAATGLVNTVGDALGVGAPYPEVQQTQADFRVLRESLLNDIASAYNRQPPSWLMEEIRSLTPSSGSVFEGTGSAQSKLTALGRSLAYELRVTEQLLERQLSPENRQKLEAQQIGLQAGIARVQAALASFGGQQGQQSPQPSQGQQVEPDAEGWTTLPNGVRIREVQ